MLNGLIKGDDSVFLICYWLVELMLRKEMLWVMIVDRLQNLKKYTGLNRNLDRAIDEISRLDVEGIPTEEVRIDGERVYFKCELLRTRDEEEALFEAHRKYIDVHICLGGRERIKGASIHNLSSVAAYDEGKDVEWLNGSCEWDVTLKEGEFMICFEEDAHKPLLDHGEQAEFKKMIVKAEV